MRKLKFRIWSPDEKKILDDASAAIMLDLAGDIQGSAGPMEVMQFTGIKDKTGKEVYEGDRCTGGFAVACMIGNAKTGTVVYNPAQARYELKSAEFSVPLGMVTGLEITGNIFENPD